MAEIKLINETTDLSNIGNPIGWDLVIGGVPFDVYRVDGHNHSIGGRWGENSYWACPADENPTYENLIQFNGDAPTWGVSFDRVNYIRNKWNQTSVEANGKGWITRNGEKFYEITGRDMNYVLAKAQYYIVKLQEELPLSLSARNWKQEATGEKIWYDGNPAVISYVTNDNQLFIKPDGIESFAPPVGWEGDYLDYEDGLVVDLLSSGITWFRE